MRKWREELSMERVELLMRNESIIVCYGNMGCKCRVKSLLWFMLIVIKRQKLKRIAIGNK